MDGEPKEHLCPGCGTPLTGSERSCPNCGTEVGGAEELAESQRETRDEPGGSDTVGDQAGP